MSRNNLFSRFMGISQYLKDDQDMSSCLEQLAEIVAGLLRAERCSIMLINKSQETEELKLGICAHFGDLPAAAYDKHIDLKAGISGFVFLHEEPLLVDDIKNAEYGELFRFSAKHTYDGFIVTPIPVSGSVAGVLNISRPDTPRRFSNADLDVAVALAFLLGQFIQIYQLNRLFQSNFAQFAIANEASSRFSEDINQMINNNDKAIKVLAKSFYRELKRAGFNRDLIIGSASEIISLVADDLKASRPIPG